MTQATRHAHTREPVYTPMMFIQNRRENRISLKIITWSSPSDLSLTSFPVSFRSVHQSFVSLRSVPQTCCPSDVTSVSHMYHKLPHMCQSNFSLRCGISEPFKNLIFIQLFWISLHKNLGKSYQSSFIKLLLWAETKPHVMSVSQYAPLHSDR